MELRGPASVLLVGGGALWFSVRMRLRCWFAIAAIALTACGGGSSPARPAPAGSPAPFSTPGAAADIVLDGETLVAVRLLPPSALSADRLEAAGTAQDAASAQVSVARASAGGVTAWEYVSSAAEGWQVWEPKSVRDARADAGPGASIVSVEPVDWNDACLGAARGGETCAQVVTPGYRIVAAQGGSRIEYHTGRVAGLRRLAV